MKSVLTLKSKNEELQVCRLLDKTVKIIASDLCDGSYSEIKLNQEQTKELTEFLKAAIVTHGKKQLIQIYEKIHEFNSRADVEWASCSQLLQYLTTDEINDFEKKKYIWSNGAEHDGAEPSYKLMIK